MNINIHEDGTIIDDDDESGEALYQQMREEYYPEQDENEQVQAAIYEMVENSPVVGYCKQDCGKPIKEAEIKLGMASDDTCTGCTLDYVADLIG